MIWYIPLIEILENVVDVGLQNVSLRTIDSLDTLILNYQTHSAFLLPVSLFSNLAYVLNSYTQTSHASVNHNDVLTAAQQSNDTLRLAVSVTLLCRTCGSGASAQLPFIRG